jgi:pimeloyl-ACP methyl ester carboxylesterase
MAPVMRDDLTGGSVRSTDGTSIAWFREPPPDHRDGPSRPALVLVHGTTADHTTFRVFGPRMAASRVVISMDRRGRGASGDGPAYAFDRELEDVASVAAVVAEESGGPVDLFGHSFGGRCALGAAALAPGSVRRVVSYEGAFLPPPSADDAGLIARLAELHERARWAELLEVFLREGVGMTDGEWQAFRDAPVWDRRLAASPTVVRELRAGRTPGGSLERLARLDQPVLQVVGAASGPAFLDGARALARRLLVGRLEVIAGARHAAHHTHVDELTGVVASFLDG